LESIMVFTVHCNAQHWYVLDPEARTTASFARGADAFDVAAELAQEHHRRTGQHCIVRVEALGGGVDVLRIGA